MTQNDSILLNPHVAEWIITMMDLENALAVRPLRQGFVGNAVPSGQIIVEIGSRLD